MKRMDYDGNRRMDENESITDEFDPTIYEPLRREQDDDDELT